MEKNNVLTIFSSAAFMLFVAVAIASISPVSASAATVSLAGNDSNSRTQFDTATNFTIIDTNHPATSLGQISEFDYYTSSSNMNPFSFVLVDASNVVQWVSPTITPASSGMNTYTPTSPVTIQPGWNLGAYFSSTGTIPFENTGATASWTSSGSGMPTGGMTLSFMGSSPRTYSMVAMGTISPVLTSVTLSPSTAALNVSQTQQLTPNPLDQNSMAFSGATFGYMSNNTSVATVSSSGLVTAVAPGTATITVTATSGSTDVTGTAVITINTATVTPYLPAPIPTPGIDYYIGNDALTVRTQLDTNSNFTVVDTNNPSVKKGYVTEIDYYASNMNPFEFVLVNGSNTVEWISPTITPSVIGFNNYEPASPLAIGAGWNIGAHFDSTGTIPFELTGAPASWTANNSGMPTMGATLSVAGSGARTYSIVAAEVYNKTQAEEIMGINQGKNRRDRDMDAMIFFERNYHRGSR